jgi:hypothetical protein
MTKTETQRFFILGIFCVISDGRSFGQTFLTHLLVYGDPFVVKGGNVASLNNGRMVVMRRKGTMERRKRGGKREGSKIKKKGMTDERRDISKERRQAEW